MTDPSKLKVFNMFIFVVVGAEYGGPPRANQIMSRENAGQGDASWEFFTFDFL